MIDKAAQFYLGSATVGMYLQTFEEFPPSQRPDSWAIDKLTERYLSPDN
jgi:arylsulfatase